MKKTMAFLFSLILVVTCLVGTKFYLDSAIDEKYFGKLGDNLSADKFKSIILQEEGINRGDNLFMFGSSEFETAAGYSTHASHFFDNLKDGFQVNLVGKAGYKCLVHVADIGTICNIHIS